MIPVEQDAHTKRILIVGGGLIGARHVAEVAAHPKCDMVGLVDPNPDISSSAERFQSMKDVTSRVDGVIIATPTHLHADHGAYAAERGWPMLIEKPVAQTVQQAITLQTALRNTGLPTLVGHHRRYHASVKQLKNLVAQGLIGDVVTCSLIWSVRKPDAYFHANWRTAGGSPVMINLVHDIDLLRFVMGDIAQTAALRGAGLRGAERIEAGAIALLFESGATGTISFADTAPSPWGFEAGTGENPNIGMTGEDMFWISGTKGALSFPSLTHWRGSDWSRPAEVQPMPVLQNTQTPLAAQLDHFLDVIDGAAPLIDVADATQTLAIAQDIEAQLQTQNARVARRDHS